MAEFGPGHRHDGAREVSRSGHLPSWLILSAAPPEAVRRVVDALDVPLWDDESDFMSMGDELVARCSLRRQSADLEITIHQDAIEFDVTVLWSQSAGEKGAEAWAEFDAVYSVVSGQRPPSWFQVTTIENMALAKTPTHTFLELESPKRGIGLTAAVSMIQAPVTIEISRPQENSLQALATSLGFPPELGGRSLLTLVRAIESQDFEALLQLLDRVTGDRIRELVGLISWEDRGDSCR
jgi:hypothetical protein